MRAKGDSQGHDALWIVFHACTPPSMPMFESFPNSSYSYSNSESVTFHVKLNKPTCSPFSCSQSLEPVL